MYRVPEKQSGSRTVFNCARSCFYQYANHHFSICFVSFLYYFVQAEFFHVNLSFQKEKNFEETLCLQPRQFVHPPDFAGDKNVDFEFPDACLFGHSFYFGYQDFIS